MSSLKNMTIFPRKLWINLIRARPIMLHSFQGKSQPFIQSVWRTLVWDYEQRKEWQQTEGQRKQYNNPVHFYFLSIQPYTSPGWLAKLFYWAGFISRAYLLKSNPPTWQPCSNISSATARAYLLKSNPAWQPCSNISSATGICRKNPGLCSRYSPLTQTSQAPLAAVEKTLVYAQDTALSLKHLKRHWPL